MLIRLFLFSLGIEFIAQPTFPLSNSPAPVLDGNPNLAHEEHAAHHLEHTGWP